MKKKQLNDQSGKPHLATLDGIASEVGFELGEGLERYEQYLYWAEECWKDFKLDLAKEVKTVAVGLTPWKAIKWPDDYFDFVKIGVLYGKTLLTFVNDDFMPLLKNSECIAASVSGSNIANGILNPDASRIGFANFGNSNELGENTGGLYGYLVKNHTIGYYRVNREAREIQLDPKITTQGNKVYLEYIAISTSPSGQTFVNPVAKKLIKRYVRWMRLDADENAPLSRVKYAEDQYWNEWERVAARISDIGINEIYQWMEEEFTMVPK